MVERIENVGLEEFKGTVKSVEQETGIEDRRQYHIKIDAIDVEVGGATGLLHEWVPLSPTATEEAVPQGSVLDRYLTQVEICISEAKKASTVEEALNMMVGKTFKFKRLKLGRDYEGHKAKEYIAPVALIE